MMPPPGPGRQDPFSQLGLPATFELTPSQIEAAFLRASAVLHPDVTGVEDEPDASVAAVINQARETLLHAESRADALLVLQGGPGRADDRGLPEGFLEAIMQVREEVEAARSAGDQDALARWRAWAYEQRHDYVSRVASLFQGAMDLATRVRVRRELNAWRYIERLLEQLDPSDLPSA